MRITPACIRWLLIATLLLTALRPWDACAQTRGRVENSPGIVIFKRYAWSPPSDLLAAEFVSYVDRRAEFQNNRGYIQFRLPRNQVRQVPGDSVVDIVLFSELGVPPNLLTNADELALRDRLEKADRLASYSDAVAAIVGPYLAALRNDLDQFSSGRVKQDGAWRERTDHVAAAVDQILTEIRAGGVSGRKELESRIKNLQSEGHSGPLFETRIRSLREAWVGMRLDRAAATVAAGRGRAAADMLEELRMDIGSTVVPQALLDRMRSLGEEAGQLIVNSRRSDLLQELRTPGTNEGRLGAVLRELDTMGVTAPDDLALLESTRERLNRSVAANRTVDILTSETNSLFDTAALRRAEAGAYFKTGDTALRDLSTKLSSAWQSTPESESEARAALADLQSLIETAGQMNFHLSGDDWSAVPGLLTRIRDIGDRVGAGKSFIEGVNGQVAERRQEVSRILAEAEAKEASGNQSEAFLLYLKASELFPDERATREVRRLSEQALGL